MKDTIPFFNLRKKLVIFFFEQQKLKLIGPDWLNTRKNMKNWMLSTNLNGWLKTKKKFFLRRNEAFRFSAIDTHLEYLSRSLYSSH